MCICCGHSANLGDTLAGISTLWIPCEGAEWPQGALFFHIYRSEVEWRQQQWGWRRSRCHTPFAYIHMYMGYGQPAPTRLSRALCRSKPAGKLGGEIEFWSLSLSHFAVQGISMHLSQRTTEYVRNHNNASPLAELRRGCLGTCLWRAFSPALGGAGKARLTCIAKKKRPRVMRVLVTSCLACTLTSQVI